MKRTGRKILSLGMSLLLLLGWCLMAWMPGNLVSAKIINGYDVTDNCFLSGDYLYILSEDGTAAIGHYFGSDTSLTIPSQMDEYTVTSIYDGLGTGVFSECTNLVSVIIPDSITEIGTATFYECPNLTNIVLPNNITKIGASAFKDCTSLTSIDLPDSITEIRTGAFENCAGLTSIDLPDNITEIGDFAFSGCSALTDVYYSGTEEQWEDIKIANGNEALTNAIIHYNNSTLPSLEQESTEEATDFGQVSSDNTLLIAVIAGIVVLVLFLAAVMVIIILLRRQKK